ncbi:MAG: MFS transporter [Actinomycetota bacterium]|nr:MFS transporter [Actinomycetota bacterium]
MPSEERVNHKTIALLGIETICVYGAWWYSFGVLLDPILSDTGWSETAVAGAFSAGVVVIGVGSIFGGRLLDRLGSRPVFVVAALIGGVGLTATSYATNTGVFFVGTATSLGAFGALGFYHVTMTTAVRSSPAAPTKAISVLTVWGALASAIYLPFAAFLVERTDWRVSIRVLGATAVASLLLAAFGASVPPDPTPGPRPTLRDVAADTWRPGRARGFTITVALAGISFTTLLVYQVPVMVAAGLPLTTAATAAAVRGFCQLLGRVPLSPLVAKVGSEGAVIAAMSALAAGGFILIVAGTTPVALLFAVVAGFGIGAWSPLQGIRANELFKSNTLGATMGLFTTVSSTAGALGPVLAGFIADTTGERRWGAVMSAGAALAAAIVFALTQFRAENSSHH